MNLRDLIVIEALKPSLEAVSRDDVLEELVGALAGAKAITRKIASEAAKSCIARENKATTGIGKGIAMPHARVKGVKKPVATIGKCSTGVDFGSLDNKPVHAVILTISDPDNPAEHLKAMELIFKCVKDDMFRKFLLQAQTSEAIIDLLKETDGTD